MSVSEFKGGRERHLEIAVISQVLKQIAKEIGCLIITLCQLNRNLEYRNDKRTLSTDLRDSSALD